MALEKLKSLYVTLNHELVTLSKWDNSEWQDMIKDVQPLSKKRELEEAEKKPRKKSAYSFFRQEMYAEKSDSVKVSGEIRKKWKACDDSTKKKYQDMADESNESLKSVKKTKTRRMTGYNMFVSEKMAENTQEPPNQRLSAISELWKKLSTEERAVYQTKADLRTPPTTSKNNDSEQTVSEDEDDTPLTKLPVVIDVSPVTCESDFEVDKDHEKLLVDEEFQKTFFDDHLAEKPVEKPKEKAKDEEKVKEKAKTKEKAKDEEKVKEKAKDTEKVKKPKSQKVEKNA